MMFDGGSSSCVDGGVGSFLLFLVKVLRFARKEPQKD